MGDQGSPPRPAAASGGASSAPASPARVGLAQALSPPAAGSPLQVMRENAEVGRLRGELAAVRAELDTAMRALGRERAIRAATSPRAGWSSPTGARASSPDSPDACSGCGCVCGHEGGCASHALRHFGNTFLLAYGARSGVALLSRSLQLARKGRVRKLLDLNSLLGERSTVYRVDAVRLGLFCGGFTGLYHGLRCLCARRLGREPGDCAHLAGAGAGLSLLFLDKNRRKTLSLYLLARLLQSWYNSAKGSGRWHFWGSDWQHGDALLFALSCSPIMYAYVMRPDTLPRGFWEFIVRMGPIDKDVLAAVRDNCRGRPLDVEALARYCTARGMPEGAVGAHASHVHCHAMHGQTGLHSCAAHNFAAGLNTFRRSFPFYLSIHLVPFAVLNTKRALRDPLGTLARTTGNAVRSTAFLSTFVSAYMACACAGRNGLMRRDHRFLYWAAGAIAGSAAIFVEKKGRRSELALYLLPRAVESVFLHLVSRKLAIKVPHGDVALFMLCMGGLMHYYEHEPETLASFLRGLITRFMKGVEPFPIRAASQRALSDLIESGKEEEARAAGAPPPPKEGGAEQARPPPAEGAPPGA